ncbi:unnamed protein product [Caenorhabditis sp. 36 PRJEB53466]|nr:unnamed protein product [Caenorhabditis sp. 36 PRJEB53466]
MGQAFSSSSNSKKQTPASTPQRAPNCPDPRSPTNDIERTPITVNTSIVNDENSFTANSATKEEKSRKMTLRQKMFERKKNGTAPADD